MKTLYINGVKASKEDLRILNERCKSGIERIVSLHTTKSGYLAITTD